MNRDIKSRGRKKRVTSGGGNVYKRGEGLSNSKPVGGNTEYSKKQSFSSSTSSKTNYSPASRSFSKKRIIILIIIVVIGFFVLRKMGMLDDMLSLDTSTLSDPSAFSQTQNTNQIEQGELDTDVSKYARSKYTKIKGDGQDIYTLMIYMCGSDLESRSGMATADLSEIIDANIGENMNIIIETGGAKTWKNSVVSNRTNQRYRCTDKGLQLLEGNLGMHTMTDPDTLSSFITYSKENFPADRYSLILWDHGGGSNQGFGYDEFATGQTMTLDEINVALKKADCKFDFVGFDACLMATYETALMLDQYADYLIASEETEPGIGWYYTDWLTSLSRNTSQPTTIIGKHIIDDFISKCAERSPMDKTTLSLIDLSEFSGTVPAAFKSFASSTGDIISSDQYQLISNARANTKEFGVTAKIDQIDLIHLAQNIDTTESNTLIDVLKNSIKYNKTSNTIANSYGVSIYFPYQKLSNLQPMLNTYDEIGMDDAYTDCIQRFANLEVGGQALAGGQTSPLDTLLESIGQTTPVNPSSGQTIGASVIQSLLGSFLAGDGLQSLLGGATQNWVNKEEIQNSATYYEDNLITQSELSLTPQDDSYVLSLPDEKWETIQTLVLNVFYDEGEGFIDLGLDNVYQFNQYGELMMDYDRTWVAIDEQVVSYYLVSEDDKGDNYIITGRVPALLNGDPVNLILIFDDQNPYGQVVGADILYQDSPDTIAKGLIDIEIGDQIDFMCDYYSYDGTFMDSYMLGDPMIVEDELFISNVDIGDGSCKMTYRLTDIYNNHFWTPAITY